MSRKTLPNVFFLLLIAQSLLGQAELIYGLNFYGSSLKFTTMDINSGTVEILSDTPLSPDLFQQGVADFDPNEKRYFYVRGLQENTKIYTVDALTGEVVSNPVLTTPTSPGNSTVAPITNIAYNWLDNELYGINHQFNNTEQLRLAKVDLNSGEVTLISNTPTSTGPYITSNSDIDPINRRYIYATTEKIYTVDLDNGELIASPNIIYPMTGGQFTTNLTYDWQNNIIYCLHFLSVSNPNPFGEPISELRLATIDPATGLMTLISQDITSNDGFSMGDCDIDPSGNRYFYIRQNELYIVSLSDGTVINQIPIDNLNNAIAPIINMTYDDLTIPPTDINMEMGGPFELANGAIMELNAWVGDEANYMWQDGQTTSSIQVDQPGDYAVTITKDAFTIKGNVRLEGTTVSTNDLDNEIGLNIFPNPSSDYLQYEIEQPNILTNPNFDILDLQGRVLKSISVTSNQGKIDIRALTPGSYFIRYEVGERQLTKSFLRIK